MVPERGEAKRAVQGRQVRELHRAHSGPGLVDGRVESRERAVGRRAENTEKVPIVAVESEPGQVQDQGEKDDPAQEEAVGQRVAPLRME